MNDINEARAFVQPDVIQGQEIVNLLSQAASTNQLSQQGPLNINDNAHVSFWSCFEALCAQQSFCNNLPTESETQKLAISAEISLFLSVEKLPMQSEQQQLMQEQWGNTRPVELNDPRLWWKNNKDSQLCRSMLKNT